MNGLGLTKSILDLVVSTSVSTIISTAVKSTMVDGNTKILRRVSLFIGGTILSNMVAEQAVKYADEKFDKTVNTITKVMATAEAMVEEQEL